MLLIFLSYLEWQDSHILLLSRWGVRHSPSHSILLEDRQVKDPLAELDSLLTITELAAVGHTVFYLDRLVRRVVETGVVAAPPELSVFVFGHISLQLGDFEYSPSFETQTSHIPTT